MTTLLLDLRHTIRALRRTPLLFASAALSLAVGIGANTAIYSWMDNLVLNPFPGIRDPRRIIGLETAYPTGDAGPVAYAVLRDWQDATNAVTAISPWTMSRLSARLPGETSSRSLIATLVGGRYFEVLNPELVAGRGITASDEALRVPVVVLGYAAWQREFAGDLTVIGRGVVLNGQPFTVVGIAAADFAGVYLGVVPDLFVPITLQPLLTGQDQLNDRAARSFQAVARLAPGVTLAQAARDLDASARRISRLHAEKPVVGADIKEIRVRFLGGLVSPVLSATLVVTGLLLLVACANVAGLLLVRATSRSAELSLRLALGARGGQLARLALMESLLLGIGGSCLGVAMAYAVRGALASFIPVAAYPISLSIDLNGRVMAFGNVAALLVSVLSGIVPALRSGRTDVGAALRAVSQSLAPAASRARFVIVGAQVAFSLVCLVTAGLFVRGLQRSSEIDVGFTSPEQVLLVNTDLAPAQIEAPRRTEMVQSMLRELRRIPGVEFASVASFVPLGFGGRRSVPLKVDGYVAAPNEEMSVLRIGASSDYAATMGLRVEEGREFNDADRTGAGVALVNATFAKKFWPSGSAVGRRIDLGTGWLTIVGVLRDGKYGTLFEKPQAVAYTNIEQSVQGVFTMQLRTTRTPMTLVEDVRSALQRVHVDLPVLQPRSLSNHVSASTIVPRIGATVLSVFGGIALLLSLIGLHASVAYSVATRTRELGIRRALGATPGHVVGVVVRPALFTVGLGVAVGCALSAAIGTMLRARLPDVATGLDPIALSASIALMVLAATIATWFPARRAVRVNPSLALRDG